MGAATNALETQFTAYGEELERVKTFKYLGRLMAQDDSDVQAVRANLRKARKVWAQISRVLRSENAEPRVCGMFYKATVQAVLLFGSETWNVSTAMLARLEGFHIRAAYQMARDNKPLRNAGGWEYPASGDVLKEVGLYTVEHYIRVRRDTIAAYIMHQSIFDDCRGRGQRRGSRPRQFWWDQPMTLDGARGAVEAEPGFGGGKAGLL